jgi:8-amino-7-oxononanoate synthase
MIDFASTLYLGMQHPSTETGSYDALTTGTPASLEVSPLSVTVAAQAAALQGCEAGMVASSTLHLSIDVLDRLGRTHAIIADQALYPVMRWGLERIMGLGVPVIWFRHGDATDLARHIRQLPHTRPPAVIVDATSVEGSPAPIRRYLALVRRHSGLLAIDQSQTLGLLGERPCASHPWGRGGGGVLRYADIAPAEPVLLLASWAKAFGAPLATLCGPATLVNEIARDGPTQSHCSTASQNALLAAMSALAINQRDGERLRTALSRLVARLDDGLRWLVRHRLPDLQILRRFHPLQQIRLDSTERTVGLHAALRARGFRTALLRQCGPHYALAVVVRASHHTADIDALTAAIGALAPRLPQTRARSARSVSMEESGYVQDLRG